MSTPPTRSPPPSNLPPTRRASGSPPPATSENVAICAMVSMLLSSVPSPEIDSAPVGKRYSDAIALVRLNSAGSVHPVPAVKSLDEYMQKQATETPAAVELAAPADGVALAADWAELALPSAHVAPPAGVNEYATSFRNALAAARTTLGFIVPVAVAVQKYMKALRSPSAPPPTNISVALATVKVGVLAPVSTVGAVVAPSCLNPITTRSPAVTDKASAVESVVPLASLEAKAVSFNVAIPVYVQFALLNGP